MADDYLRVSDLVRDAADRYGMSQQALAHALGITRPALNARLQCHTRWTLSEVVALSALLDLNPHALLDAASDGDEVLAS